MTVSLPLATKQAVIAINTGSQCTAPMEFAADELRRYFRLMTGQPRAERGACLPGEIRLNDHESARADGCAFDETQFHGDAFMLHATDKRLHILASTARGVLYGAYELLSRFGVRWWTPELERVPRAQTLAWPIGTEMHRPAFEFRDILANDTQDPLWRVRNRYNGHYSPIPEYLGGYIQYGLFVHTFYHLVPPARHFDAHPEYFSLVGGTRRREGAQLCLSNPDVARIAAERVLEAVRAKPTLRIFSVSQNDWDGACECPACAAIVEREGAQSGPMVHFANAVAALVCAKHPEVLIDTLAYHYSVDAPRFITPHPNVRIRLCPIGCCQGHAFGACEQPKSVQFLKALNAWTSITPQLYIWHYCTNFTSYLLPMPNFDELEANIRLYHERGVHGIFLQGGTFGAEAMDIRSYVLGKMLWNPSVSFWDTAQEWLEGVHGKAATGVRAYHEHFHNLVRQNRDLHPVCYAHPDDTLMDSAVIATADAELAKAELMSTGFSKKRIRHIRNGLALPALYRKGTDYRIDGEHYHGNATPEDAATFDRIVRDETAFGTSELNEGTPLPTGARFLRARLAWHNVLWLEDGQQRIAIVPELGGRMVEWHALDRQWLCPADPGNRWQQYPFSGGGCEFAITGVHTFAGWQIPYTAKRKGKAIQLRGSYRHWSACLDFERTLRLADGVLHIESRIVNRHTSASNAYWDTSMQWHTPAWTCFTIQAEGYAAECLPDALPDGLERARKFANTTAEGGEWRLETDAAVITGSCEGTGIGEWYLGRVNRIGLVAADTRSIRLTLQPGEHFAMRHSVSIRARI